MCGRYTQTLPAIDVAETLGLEKPDFSFVPRFNAAPTQLLPLITDAEPKRMQLFRWGLIPFWAKDPAIGNRMINARAETVAVKPAYKHAFKKRRCLIVADGFYEWKKTPHGKVPHHIRLKSHEVMTLAGLWERWVDKETGEEISSFTLITTQPNELMVPIHDRMPVIVAPHKRDEWLASTTSPEDLQELLVPYPADQMEAQAVSTLVNSPRNDGPELLLKDTLF